MPAFLCSLALILILFYPALSQNRVSCPPGSTASASCTTILYPTGGSGGSKYVDDFNCPSSITACEPCPAGKYSPLRGPMDRTCYPAQGCQTAITSNAPGGLNTAGGQNAAGEDYCRTCPAGTYGTVDGGWRGAVADPVSSQCAYDFQRFESVWDAGCESGFPYSCSSTAFGSGSSGNPGVCTCPKCTSCNPCPRGTYNPFPLATTIGACQACPPGSYSETLAADSATTCILCPVGSAGADAGRSLPCTLCGPGRSTPQPGSTECVDCFPGTYSAGGGSPCLLCAAGTYTARVGASSSAQCLPCTAAPGAACGPGSATPAGAQCPPGYFCPGGASLAQPCPPGTWGDAAATPGLTSAANCTRCAAGTASAASAASSSATCKACAAGSFALTGAPSCTNCTAGTHSALTPQPAPPAPRAPPQSRAPPPPCFACSPRRPRRLRRGRGGRTGCRRTSSPRRPWWAPW